MCLRARKAIITSGFLLSLFALAFLLPAVAEFFASASTPANDEYSSGINDDLESDKADSNTAIYQSHTSEDLQHKEIDCEEIEDNDENDINGLSEKAPTYSDDSSRLNNYFFFSDLAQSNYHNSCSDRSPPAFLA